MVAAMRFKPIDLLVLLALIVGMAYFGAHRMGARGDGLIAAKGACVGLLALWAAVQARSLDGWLIAAVMALGAIGDVVIETNGLDPGAIAFLAGHVVAIGFYLRNREGSPWTALSIALVVALVAWLLPAARAMAPGIAFYALGLGGMAGTALISRFPRNSVGAGALMFVASDLLIFAQLGLLHGSMLPNLLIWPLYVSGQASIAWGVMTTLRHEAEA
jgi:uncharacterized membrane protein YhhN